MKLIVGLGNPGKLYVNNRHNVGFMCLDYFSRKQGIPLNRSRAWSQYGVGEVTGSKVILAKPRTFMNLSGRAVAALMRYYRLPKHNILVVYDDLALPFGRIRIRESGSSGGHNGMKSIINHLCSQSFPRLRVGIAPREDSVGSISKDVDVVEYVLGDYSIEEKVSIREVYPKVHDAICCLITEGITAAMNKYN